MEPVGGGALPALQRAVAGCAQQELAAAFNDKTKAIIINTPNNPTGKVFGREELKVIADLCQKWDVLAITDEIYEHIIYDGAEHVSPITLDGMRERARAVGGTVHAGPRADGGYEVTATVPAIAPSPQEDIQP